MSNSHLILALDFGGTKLAAAVVERGAKSWEALRRVPSPPEASVQADLDIILKMAQEVLAGRTPIAVGVSFGGPVDPDNGRVLLSHRMTGWENFPLRDHLQAALNAPVYVDNDANAAALGEWRFGVGVVPQKIWPLYVNRVSSLLYVTVSTGVGGGVVSNGVVWQGADRLAGEIGHIVLDPQGPECNCGQRGCVEALASGPSIARQAREQLAANPQAGQVLRDIVNHNLPSLTAEHVAHAADEGDPLALQVLTQAAHALGHGLGIAITLLNPEVVVLGGGVTKSGERYLDAVRESTRQHTFKHARVDIRLASFGDDAPLWGAVARMS